MGHALLDATKAIVIAQCGQALSRLPRRTNMFSSTAAILQDDAGDRLGVGEDFDKEVYRELIELYTSPADWIINVQLSTGTIGWLEHAPPPPPVENLYTLSECQIEVRKF